MDNYIINKNSGRAMKIGSKAHKTAIIRKVRQSDDNKTILTNIEHQETQKLKKSLPALSEDKFYYYESKTKSLITKNKSLKSNEIIIHICNQLPSIIDRILNEIDETDDRDKTKAKMIRIFHESIY